MDKKVKLTLSAPAFIARIPKPSSRVWESSDSIDVDLLDKEQKLAVIRRFIN